MNYLYHLDVVDELKRELALARASSDYWRAKYLLTAEGRRTSDILADKAENARKWLETALRDNQRAYVSATIRSPMDECDE